MHLLWCVLLCCREGKGGTCQRPCQRWPGVEVGDPVQVNTELEKNRRAWGTARERARKHL